MKKLFFLCCFLLFFVGCGTKQQVSGPISQVTPTITQRIFVLGDSLSAGYQLPLEQSYPMVLEKKLTSLGYAIKVINGGESGDTSAGLKERLDWIIADAKPGDIAVVVIGANDGLQGLPIEQLEKNILDVTNILQSRGLQVVIGGMQIPTNLGDAYRKAFADLYPRVAQQTKSVLIPFVLSGVAGIPSLNLPDAIHPNASGQVIIAELLMSYVIPLL